MSDAHALKHWKTYDAVCTVTDFFTTESISLLQSRFLYYRVDFCTTESILVLQSRSWHYRVDFGITESNLVLQSRSWYYKIDFATTESILVKLDQNHQFVSEIDQNRQLSGRT